MADNRADFVSRLERVRRRYARPELIRDVSLFEGGDWAVVRVEGQPSVGQISMNTLRQSFLEVWKLGGNSRADGMKLMATVLLPAETENPVPVALSQDGSFLAYPGRGRTVQIEILESLSETQTVPDGVTLISPSPSPGNHVTALEFPPGTGLLLTGTEDGRIYLHDRVPGAKPTVIPSTHVGPVVRIVNGAGGISPFASLSRGSRGKVLMHGANVAHELKLKHGNPVEVVISQIDGKIAVTTESGWLELFDADRNPIYDSSLSVEKLRILGVDPELFQNPGHLRFSSDGAKVILSSMREASGIIWNFSSGFVGALVISGSFAEE